MHKSWTAYDVIKITSPTQNYFFQNIQVNTNPRAKFCVFMTFGFEIRQEEIFAPFPL